MRIKNGFVLREVAGQGVVIATGEASKSFHGMVKLNVTGSEIWKGIEAGLSEKEIAEKLAGKYEADQEEIAKDVQDMINRMKEAGFVAEN